MGGGWADGKRTQWLEFLILRKTERMAEFVEGKRESERKRLCAYSSVGRSMARGLVEARSPLSFFCFFHRVFTLHRLSLSSCFFLYVFIASLSISLPLYFYLCVTFNFNRLFFVIYNERILNGVVTLPNNTMYRFLK